MPKMLDAETIISRGFTSMHAVNNSFNLLRCKTDIPFLDDGSSNGRPKHTSITLRCHLEVFTKRICNQVMVKNTINTHRKARFLVKFSGIFLELWEIISGMMGCK